MIGAMMNRIIRIVVVNERNPRKRNIGISAIPRKRTRPAAFLATSAP
jgi:hypothetical protein